MKRINAILDQNINSKRPKNLSREFQFFGCTVCEALGDTKHYSLYIKLAKDYPRWMVQEALNFVQDYPSAKSKPRLFMWRLNQLKKSSKEVDSNNKPQEV